MQTLMPCLRRSVPRGLRLPLAQRLAVHGILSAGVLGLLLYPLSLGVVAWALIAGLYEPQLAGRDIWLLIAINLGNLGALFVAGAIAAARGLIAIGARHLIWHIPLLPIYWGLMSFASWQALFQFFRSPSRWEKTTHGIARDRRRRKARPLI